MRMDSRSNQEWKKSQSWHNLFHFSGDILIGMLGEKACKPSMGLGIWGNRSQQHVNVKWQTCLFSSWVNGSYKIRNVQSNFAHIRSWDIMRMSTWLGGQNGKHQLLIYRRWIKLDQRNWNLGVNWIASGGSYFRHDTASISEVKKKQHVWGVSQNFKTAESMSGISQNLCIYIYL